MKRSKH